MRAYTIVDVMSTKAWSSTYNLSQSEMTTKIVEF